jgi:hypothetical protein
MPAGLQDRLVRQGGAQSAHQRRSALRGHSRGEARSGRRSGGGVFTKRLYKNRNRSIILVKGGVHWVYEYLFAKKDRDNIDDKELMSFRKLAKIYEGLNDQQIDRLLKNGDFTEICHDYQA